MRRFLPLIVFAMLVCVLLWPVVFQGKVLLSGPMLRHMSPWNAYGQGSEQVDWAALTWDGLAQYYPERAFLGRALRSGELPLWNPHKMCGVPFLADPQTAVLYPPNLLYALLPADRAFSLLALLHLLAAGCFTYVFLRGLRLSRTASTFGGTAFMLGGFGVVWLGLPVFLSSGVWLPVALHCSHLAYERRSPIHAVVAGMAVALSLLGGHPQIAFYSILALALYWLHLGSSDGPSGIKRALFPACLTFGIGFALAAPQLFPMFELAAISHRGGAAPTAAGYAAYNSWAMPLWRAIAIIAPDFFGNPSRGGMWAPGEYAEYCGYAGMLVLVLVPLAFLGKGRYHRQSWFFGAVLTLSLLMVLGTGINRLLYLGVPGFGHSGSPARALFLSTFALAVLGAMGLERMLTGESGKRRWTLALPIASASGILAFGLMLLRMNVNRLAEQMPGEDLLGVLMSGLLMPLALLLAGLLLVLATVTGRMSRPAGGMLALGILAADLLSFGMGYNPASPESEVYSPTALTDFLRSKSGLARVMPLNTSWALGRAPESVLPPNSAMVYGLHDVSGYGTLYPVRYKSLLDAAAGGDSSPPESGNMVFARNPDSPVYDLLGVRWVISREPVDRSSVEMDGCYVYENEDALPRAFLVPTVEFADDREIAQRLADGQTDPRYLALVTAEDRMFRGSELPEVTTKPTVPAASDEVVITRYACNTVCLKVSATRSAVLVLTDQYYPGWEARVDGKRTQVNRADYAFRAVPVPPGVHTVEFVFAPASFERGLRWAKIALVLIAAVLIHAAAKWRSGLHRPAE